MKHKTRSKKRKRKHSRRRGLSGISVLSKSPMVQNIGKEGLNVAALLGGVFVGNMGGRMINKLLKVETLAPGFNIKKLIVPVATTGAGLVVAALGYKNPMIKHAGFGIMVSGVAGGVKVVLDKDLLAGTDQAINARYFNESADQLRQLADRDPNFNPQLRGHDEPLGAENVVSVLRIDDMSTII